MPLSLEREAAMNPKEQCRDCGKLTTQWEECANCYATLCPECVVSCSVCGFGVKCVNCAPRRGFEMRDGKWWCEGCCNEE